MKGNNYLIIVFLTLGYVINPIYPQEEGRKRDGFRHPQGPPPHPQRLSEEEIEEILDCIRKFDPDLAEDLKELKKINKREFMRKLMRARREMIKLERLKKKDPEMYKLIVNIRRLDIKSKKLADRIKRCKEKDKEKAEELKQKLRKLLEKLFDLREKRNAIEVERLEKRLKELKEKLKTRKANKLKIIERYLKKLLGEDELEW
jgi:DNA repair exonuclease SbcCD ATPase subunit